MKKIYNLMLGLLAAMAALSFTSCMDEDTHEAMVLSGQWYGDFGMYYSIQDRYGRWETFDSYDTDIVFYPEYDYATYGYGKQVDYYRYGPYAYQYYYFNWEVRNGVLYLDYPYDPDLNVAIYDYRMTYDYFKGRFDSGTRFSLRKIADYYDWGRYHGNYYGSPSDYYYDYYYSKTRSVDGDSTGCDSVVIKRGNRFNEGGK